MRQNPTPQFIPYPQFTPSSFKPTYTQKLTYIVYFVKHFVYSLWFLFLTTMCAEVFHNEHNAIIIRAL